MSTHGTLKRIMLLTERIGRRSFPSMRELYEYVFDHGFEVSLRTLQRDIEHARIEFGVEIRYDRERNGYFIDRDLSMDLDAFLRFIEIARVADVLSESIRENRETLRSVSFDPQRPTQGMEHLKDLLYAIRYHRVIRFQHRKFTSEEPVTYRFHPYFLKEYQGRWYVVGTLPPHTNPITFGLERIIDLDVLTDTFSPDEQITPEAVFQNVIGLTAKDSKEVEIVLSFTPMQGKYVKTLPMHPSQEILIDNEEEVRIRLVCVVNYELAERILMHGEKVRVISPDALVHEVADRLRRALERYR